MCALLTSGEAGKEIRLFDLGGWLLDGFERRGSLR